MASFKYAAKLDPLPTIAAPDVYIPNGLSPPDDFVVARRRDGVIASRYGEVSWDISAWHPDNRRCILNFDFWADGPLSGKRLALSKQGRWLIFVLVWLREGAPIGATTLKNYQGIIAALSHHAEASCCDIYELLSNDTRLFDFVRFECSGNMSKLLSALIHNLHHIGEEKLGFSIVSGRLRREVAKLRGVYSASWKQHPPMPTRIYSEVLLTIADQLNEWVGVEEECLAVAEDCGRDRLYGRIKSSQGRRARAKDGSLLASEELRPEWEDVASNPLRAYIANLGLRDGVAGLVRAIGEAQMLAKLQVLAYTGMREDEVTALQFSCIETLAFGGREHIFINGRTTKLCGGRKPAKWVTNLEGKRAIEIAQRIARAIYAASSIAADELASHPLFVSISYLKLSGTPPSEVLSGQFEPSGIGLSRFARLNSTLRKPIQQIDLDELTKIDALRPWQEDPRFNVGRPWPLTSHQFRRSLALYAQRSGLVSLPSLRRQLQHITDEMARYYAKGAERANDILCDGAGLDKSHFCYEWQQGAAASAGLSYFVHVVLSDDLLFGAHGAFVEQRVRANGVTFESRSETLNMFKLGELHYRETLIGGCTNPDSCASSAIDWLNIECLIDNCRNLVGRLRKLDMLIGEQTRLINSIPEDSLLYRTESTALKTLVLARTKIVARATEKRP